MIKIKNLEKNYKSNKVLKNINLNIDVGMFGLLGPNGAGKTTLMKILTTLINYDHGEISLFDTNIKNHKKIREMVGYLPQDFNIYPKMSVLEALDYLGILSGLTNKKHRHSQINLLLKKVNLDDNYKSKVGYLSGGMLRRLGIAQALIHNPRILIVDEPTAGLDPEERIRFRNMLRDFSEERVVILSTHIVEDVEFTCNNMAIINKGTLFFNGKVDNLLNKAKDKIWQLSIKRTFLEKIRKQYTIISTVSDGNGKIKLKLISNTKPYDTAIATNPTIEDAYMVIMKGEINV